MTSAFNTTLILALFAVVALRPPMPRHSSPFNLQFALGWWINEAPLVGIWWLIAGTIGTLIHPEASWWWRLVAAFAALDGLLLGWIAVRASIGPAGTLRGVAERFTGRRQSPGTPGRRGGVCCCRSSRGGRTCAASATGGTVRLGEGTGWTSTCPAEVAPRQGERQCWCTSTAASRSAARCSAPAR